MLWDTLFDQEEELRVLAQRIWQVSQDLDVSTGYTGLAQMSHSTQYATREVRVQDGVCT